MEFVTTRWSLVQQAGAGAPRALEELCGRCWPPLFAYALRRGLTVEDARDVTQSFFAALLEKDWLRRADGERGRFRSFLLRAMQRFVDSGWRRDHAEKRGGGTLSVALDDAGIAAEAATVQQAEQAVSPEEAYDRRWAVLMMERAMQRLESGMEASGRGESFRALSRFLSEPGTNDDYAAAGGPLGLSVNAVAQAVLRLRGRYREAVREEIADTLSDPAMVEEEMGALVSILTAR